MRIVPSLILFLIVLAAVFWAWRRADTSSYAWHPPVELPLLEASGPGPDSVSRACLGCHTDSPEGTAPAPEHAYMKVLVFNYSVHPVGISYDRAITGNRLMNPDPDVVLPGGKVSCLSCHDIESNRPYLLVDDYGGGSSALCLRCHSGY